MKSAGRTDLPDDRKLALAFLHYARQAEQNVELLGDVGAPFAPEPGVQCLNCDAQLEVGNLYCDPLCKDWAKFVRYVRGCLADRRIAKHDIQAAVGARLLQLNGGGYPERERSLSAEVRQDIFERDGSKCQLCGAVATEIDHVSGSSDAAINLRAICGTCNRQRAFDGTRRPDADERAFIELLWGDLARRVVASRPLRICDDDEGWARRWPALKAEAKRNRPPAPDAIDAEIIEMMGLGLTSAEIAREIGIHSTTVRRRITKLRARI